VVPLATTQFFFWVEISSDAKSAVVRYGTDPTQASYTDVAMYNPSWTSTNAWTGWPTPDSAHILLGWVDTQTLASSAQVIIRQLQVTDILSAGGGSCPF